MKYFVCKEYTDISILPYNFFFVAKEQNDTKIPITDVRKSDCGEVPPLVKEAPVSSPPRCLAKVDNKLPFHSSRRAPSLPYNFQSSKSSSRLRKRSPNKSITKSADDKKDTNPKGLKRYYSEGSILSSVQPGFSGSHTAKKFCSEEESKNPSLTKTKSFPLNNSDMDDGFNLSEIDLAPWDFEQRDNSIFEAKESTAGQ